MVVLRFVALIVSVFASSIFANTAAAGVFAQVFYNGDLCGDADIVAGMAPVTNFVGSPHCESHCKKTASDCAKIARGSLACQKSLYGAATAQVRRGCKEAAPEVRELCRQSAEEGDDIFKEVLAGRRVASQANCKAWGLQCIAACNVP